MYLPDSWMILREQELLAKWNRTIGKNSNDTKSNATDSRNSDGSDQFDVVSMTSTDDDSEDEKHP